MKLLPLVMLCSCATLTGNSTVTYKTEQGITVRNFETSYHLNNIDYVYKEVVKNTIKLYHGNKEYLLAAQKDIDLEFVPFPWGVAELQGTSIVAMVGETDGNNIKVSLRKTKTFKRDFGDSDFDIWIVGEDELLCIVAHEFTHFIANHIDNNAIILNQNHKQPFFGEESISDTVCKEIRGE